MSSLDALIEDLVAANRILAAERVVDAFGHVSARHPEDAGRFLMSRARSPEIVGKSDIMEFTLDGEPADARGRKTHLERFIHAALYEARPDIQCVVHNHSRSVIPFTITEEKLKPVAHSCASIGQEVRIWAAQDKFVDTELLESASPRGRDSARAVGDGK